MTVDDILKKLANQAVTDDEVIGAIKAVPAHYSANLIVDLGNTTDHRTSLHALGSGAVIGEIIDLMHADTFCNVVAAAGPTAGVASVQVQVSDSLLSGDFTNPTSGYAQMPTSFLSGTCLWLNSGIYASGNSTRSAPVSGAALFCSGGVQAAAFQRTKRYARANLLSGGINETLNVSFWSQKRLTGSGGGYSTSPTSGAVSV